MTTLDHGADSLDRMLADGTMISELARLEECRVATRVASNPEIFDLELERIFDRAWVFVAHESEIPSKGDFVTRYIGKDPVIVTRADGDEVHVLLNICTHRAGMACRAERGTSTTSNAGTTAGPTRTPGSCSESPHSAWYMATGSTRRCSG